MSDYLSRSGSVPEPVSSSLEDYCTACGEVRDMPEHQASVYAPPELHHDYRPFALTQEEVVERTATAPVTWPPREGSWTYQPYEGADEYGALVAAMDEARRKYCNVRIECDGSSLALSPASGGPCAACAEAISDDDITFVDTTCQQPLPGPYPLYGCKLADEHEGAHLVDAIVDIEPVPDISVPDQVLVLDSHGPAVMVPITYHSSLCLCDACMVGVTH